MKKQMIKILLLVLVTVSATIATAFGQTNTNTYAQVKKGERPVIDLSEVNESAYDKGIIKIKLKPEYTKHLDNVKISFDDKGNLVFGIDEIDKLNKKFKAQKFESVFGSSSLKNNFTDRHKLWGFHLWYRLEFDKNADIKKLVGEYSNLSEIEIAEPEYKKVLIDGSKIKNADNSRWTPDDPQYSLQWHYNNTGQSGGTVDCDIDLQEAWDIETGSNDVIVAVIDGGIQYTHPDIADNMWSGIGYNFVNGNSQITPHFHGTHVAGTISGVNNNSIGVSGIAGGNGSGNGVRLMSCQVFNNYFSNGFDVAPIWAADNGACISQNSWSYEFPGFYDQIVLDAIDYFNANGGGSQLNGGITIFAASNDNSDANYYPAYYSGTFAVAATTDNDEKAWYSNYGSWVNISAPGGETANETSGVLSTTTQNSYAWYQGTSMACPHTSGVAALIVSLAYKNNFVLNNSDVTSILENSTDDHYAQNPDYIGQLGTGRLNAYQALVETQELIGVLANPLSFTTIPASTSQIDLNWIQNSDGDDVIVAWSADGAFGAPVIGTSYSANDVIPGGGLVLYTGSRLTYDHTGLNEGHTYYYKAWSVNGSVEYSAGITSNVILPNSGSMEVIFDDDFDTDKGWTLNGEWERAAPQGLGGSDGEPDPESAFVGTNIIGLDITGLGDHPGDYEEHIYDDAISPKIDCSMYSDVHVYYRYWLNVEGNGYEKAFVNVSGDNGDTWYELFSNEGAYYEMTSWDKTSGEYGWDISNYADGNSEVILQYLIEAESIKFYSGWNIDSLRVTGVQIPCVDASIIAHPQDETVCENGDVTFTIVADGSNITYQWQKNGSDIEGAINTYYTISGVVSTDAANYTCVVSGACGSDITSNPSALTVNPSPAQPSEITGETDLCEGATETYSVTNVSGVNYTWELPSDWTGSSTTNSITVTVGSESGDVIAIPSNGYCSGTARVISIAVNTTPMQPSAILGETNLCEGTTETYSVTNVSGVTYNWELPSNWIGSSTTNSIDVTVGSTGGIISVSPSNNCGSGITRSIEISIGTTTTITTQPEDINVPEGDNVSFIVTAQGENLTYQWRFNSSDISGADEDAYSIVNVQQSDVGNYDVIINGICGNEASDVAVLTIDASSIQDLDRYGISIYPNPTSGRLNIDLINSAEDASYRIISISGKVIDEDKLAGTKNIINLDSVHKGLYFIELKLGNQIVVSKIVIE